MKLALALDLDVASLKVSLKKRKLTMGDNDEKKKYIEWMLGDESRGLDKPNSEEKKKKKKKRKVRNTKEKEGDASKHENKSSKNITNTNKHRSSVQQENKATDPSLLSTMKFEDIPEIHHRSKQAIKEVLELTSMTEIQSKTFGIAVQGIDVLGRARTGTGKTLAFLIPALERLLQTKDYVPGKSVGVLIISPTRELASQIGDQAEKLMKYHQDLSCQVIFGGTKMTRDTTLLNKRLPTILVATPGRLLDHLENTVLRNKKKFGNDVMRQTKILVLDETDRLLDMGFRNEINKVLSFLPTKEQRQTLLFSATVPQELKEIMARNMKKNYVEVDCIHDGGGNPGSGEHTNILVKQTYTILPNLESQITAVLQLVKQRMEADPNHKIVVFFPTARMVGFFAEFFNTGLGIEVIELHSKKSQSYRNKASDKFRNGTGNVLFTSDVSARGVDYPDVTDVIQVGLPESREQYIHRLGRTGRAGKEGQGILLLAPFEANFVKELKNIQISENEEASQLIARIDNQTSESVKKVMMRIGKGDSKLTSSAEQCYQAFLGYYKSNMKRITIKSKENLVDTANSWAKIMGLKEQPGLRKRTIGMMGLKGIKNLRIMSEEEFRSRK
eukprot:CAMPEP_0184870256 /NCGR_PEP_ID=MMETSP0580-20130426/36898_1 /TAXON_ID=1118495 /ORGANISM="Dactyliosolen fragilissimus" /LENGTH=614 /DNA_ID=CAMNT_0027372241 /DNA_START=303 /DNA_END=2147 /DNA_ORIENTATION=-